MNGNTLLVDSPERIERAQKVVGRLPISDCAWEVEIRRHVKRRTLPQNARHWAVCQKLAEHTGYSANDIHEFALCRFFGYAEQRIGKMVRRVPLQRSSVRDVKEFREFQESTEEWAISEFGVFLGDE